MRSSAVVALALLATACDRAPTEPEPEAVDPRTFFEPLPEPSGLDPARVELGNRLFHEPALSPNETLACASCHDIANGGDDGRDRSEGLLGVTSLHNVSTVLNAGTNERWFWDGDAETLEDAVRMMLCDGRATGTSLDDAMGTLIVRPAYVDAFAQAYPGGLNHENLLDAIAQFLASLAVPSRFDDWLRGDEEALTETERRGLDHFVTVGCVDCHDGVNVGGARMERMGVEADYFGMRGDKVTDADFGRYRTTERQEDLHVFRVPTLRNVTETGPYFHDAGADTLEEAVAVMGRVQLGVELSDEAVAAIVAFLGALTGDIPQDIALEPYPPLENQ